MKDQKNEAIDFAMANLNMDRVEAGKEPVGRIVFEQAYDQIQSERPNPNPSREALDYQAVHRFLYIYAKNHGIELNIEGDCSNEYILTKLIEKANGK